MANFGFKPKDVDAFKDSDFFRKHLQLEEEIGKAYRNLPEDEKRECMAFALDIIERDNVREERIENEFIDDEEAAEEISEEDPEILKRICVWFPFIKDSPDSDEYATAFFEYFSKLTKSQ